jgi:hypothetical protein
MQHTHIHTHTHAHTHTRLLHNFTLTQGVDAAVAEAVFEAALPRQAGDALPSSHAGLIVSVVSYVCVCVCVFVCVCMCVCVCVRLHALRPP